MLDVAVIVVQPLFFSTDRTLDLLSKPLLALRHSVAPASMGCYPVRCRWLHVAQVHRVEALDGSSAHCCKDPFFGVPDVMHFSVEVLLLARLEARGLQFHSFPKHLVPFMWWPPLRILHHLE